MVGAGLVPGNRIRLMDSARPIQYKQQRMNNKKFWNSAFPVLLLASLAILARLIFAYMRTADGGLASTSGSPMVPRDWPETDSFQPGVWSVFEAEPEPPAMTRSDNFASRFKLAGTFEAFDAPRHERKAFIDDTLLHTQVVATEGDMLDDGIMVKQILNDRVLLESNGQETELILTFSGQGQSAKQASSRQADETAAPDRETRFGVKVEENRWVLKRNKVIEYYNEILNDLDRLGKVFDSMKPVYDDERKITGYMLGIEAEADMFEAFGLKEGDYIRKVNSLPMTSHVRAEYFIKEFAADRANAFVLELERQGRPMRLTYLIRGD